MSNPEPMVAPVAESPLQAQALRLGEIFTLTVADSDSNLLLNRSINAVAGLDELAAAAVGRFEHDLLLQSMREFRWSVLFVSSGAYRSAFTSLRLGLELFVSAVDFSTNERTYLQWSRGERDISWRACVDEETGLFSKPFARLYWDDLGEFVAQYRNIAGRVYRECSEYVHGNPGATRSLPTELEHDAVVVEQFAEKIETVRLVCSFVYAMRYLRMMPDSDVEALSENILDQLSSIAPLRERFGGVVGG